MSLRSIVFVCVCALALSSATALAKTKWAVKKLDAKAFPADVVKERREAAKNGLPDGLVTVFEGKGDIAAAWYTRPTQRYRHAILGDRIEAGGFKVRTPSGKIIEFVLPNSAVFEDRYPRLVDLDNDGKIEVVTILSSLAAGGSVTIYGLDGGELKQKGTTGFIGRSNRWLNVAGIADFRGSGRPQIAFTKTPHIGGTLYFFELAQGKLNGVAGLYGFSNHVIGSAEMRLSAIVDINGDGRPDLALPSANRSKLRMIAFMDGGLVELASVALPGRINKAIAVKVDAGRIRFIVGLDNGGVYEVYRR